MPNLWNLGVVALWNLIDAGPLVYPEGIKPGDQISGNAGEFWRYKSVLIKPPDDEDRMEALKMSEDVKCAVCETILHRLMKRVESNTEDHIMDALDGEPSEIPELTGNDQEDRVNQNRRGCNKHFKDEVLLRGFAVKQCPAVTVTIEATSIMDSDSADKDPPRAKTWCLENVGGADTIDEKAVDTYNTRHEAAFYACENTVARHGHEIASFLADRLDGGAGNLASAITDACLKAAACNGAGSSKSKKQRKGSAEKRSDKKKKAPKADEEEKSMWEIMSEQEEFEKTKKKRRKKTSKKVEL